MMLLPRPSSVMVMSATLMGLAVLLDSGSELTELVNASAVGGALGPG